MEMLYRETRTTQGHYISGAASTMLGLLYRRGRKYGGTFYRSSEHCMRGLRSSSPTPLTLTIHIPQCHIPTALGHLQGQVTPPLPGQLCHCLTSLSEEKFFLISNWNLPWSNLRSFPLILSLLPGRRHQPLRHHRLLSGSCREWSDLP